MSEEVKKPRKLSIPVGLRDSKVRFNAEELRIAENIKHTSWEAYHKQELAKKDAEIKRLEESLLSVCDIERCRQWYNSVRDTTREYLEHEDYLVYEKIMNKLGKRIFSGDIIVQAQNEKRGKV